MPIKKEQAASFCLQPVLRLLFLISFFYASCSNESPTTDKEIHAKVIGVKDGDTIEVLYNGKSLTIRLEHIDCHELKKQQPFGRKAKKFTSDFCFGDNVTVINTGNYDQYHRLIGTILNSKGENLNKALVTAGLAWHFKRYSTDTSYTTLENLARNSKLGLWAENNPIAPWEWRKLKTP